MFSHKLCRLGFLHWRPHFCRYNSTESKGGSYKLCKYFSISQDKAEYICLQQPYVSKLSNASLECLIDTVHDLGFAKDVLIKEPVMFSFTPVTLRFRYKVLEECGFVNITPKHISSYLPLTKQNSIGQLKRFGELPAMLKVENRLASFMTQWPTSLDTLIHGDINEATLSTLRLKILQRYLELVLDLTADVFHRALKSYPRIKHCPLEAINETLKILQSVMIPDKKIKANLYLLHVDPENLKKIVYKLRSIGGIDIKEILRLCPRLATKKYEDMVEIRNIMQEYGINDEAQRRCFYIYTMSPETLRVRLKDAMSIPEFKTFLDHPRFLKMIYYKKTVMDRLQRLYNNKKKCVSLNILTESAARFEVFENASGDRLGKGRDLVTCISQSLGDIYSASQISNMVKRHPFWINVPLVRVKFVYQRLSKKFGAQDIYENCPILLYPWNEIKKVLDIFEGKGNPANSLYSNEILDIKKLDKSQKLSLVLYYLEKEHYFSGNGVWADDKCTVPD